MKYKMVVFDLDGTILNTIGDLCASCNYALDKVNLPLITVEQTKNYLGFGVRQLVKSACLDDERLDDILACFINHYSMHYNDFTYSYDGIKDVINYCHENNIMIGVLTNKVEEIAKKLCDYHFKDDFLFVYGDVEERSRKPNPDVIYKIMNDYNIKNNEFLYVGDSEVDMKVSINADVDCVLCTYGFRKKDDLYDCFPNASFVDCPIELINYLK